jgi:hypothetical protein
MTKMAENMREKDYTNKEEQWMREQWEVNPNFGFDRYGRRDNWVRNREEENWRTETRYAFQNQSMVHGTVPRWNNGNLELIEKKEIVRNPNLNLVEFAPEKFDPHGQPELSMPHNRVGIYSPYKLEKTDKPHYFPYAYGDTSLVTNSKLLSKQMKLNGY